MTKNQYQKQKWVRGALLGAVLAACQSDAPLDEPQGVSEGTQDIAEALARLPEANVLQSSADGVPQFIVGDLGRIDPTHEAGLARDDRALRAALPPILKAFRLEDKDLVLRKINTDEVGGRHYRYAQTFNGHDVVGGDLVVHVDFTGAITGANGTARGDIAPSLGAVAISEHAASLSIEDDGRWAGLAGRSIRGSRTVYVQTAAGTLHKAYEQIVEGTRGQDPVVDKVYIDVENGAVVAVHPQIHHARNRATYSANNGTALPGTLQRTETQGPTGDADVNAAHDGAGHTYDMYKFFWNRDSFDNAGTQLRSSVHYSTNYCNAFWNNVQMVYGDGNPAQGCGRLARSIDVAAHEMTHAVTSRESKLTYSGESGGLNESLSDVWGAGVEAFADGGKDGTLTTTPDVFLLGDEVRAPFLRSMCDPAADGQSRDVWSLDLGLIDVHYSSGPNNLVFCLLTKGGVHPRGKTSNYVPAIGMEKTLRLMYKANTDILTASSNYAAMRSAMLTAAQQLGYDLATQDAIASAYAAIRVGTAPNDGVLQNNVSLPLLTNLTAGSFQYWSFDVPAGQSTLTFTTSGGTGDVDLYVNYDSKPTTTTFQCRPWLDGNNETCTFTAPAAGKYWVGLQTYAPYVGVTLTASYGDTYIQNGVAVPGLTGAINDMKYYRINVPAGKNLVIRTSGGLGDLDLYTRFGARPTLSDWDCAPYIDGSSAETCNHTTTAAGDWYIMLHGFRLYTGVQLIASY
jgi:vibriolysin